MRVFLAALGLGLVSMPGVLHAFVAPAGGAVPASSLRKTSRPRAADGMDQSPPTAEWRRSFSSAGWSPATGGGRGGGGGARKRLNAVSVLSARAGRDAEEVGDERPSAAAAMSGVGSTGSNVLLLLAMAMVLKGLLLPEDVRHLGFCPPDDPIRGRDTLPWRMMIESGRECGTIEEVMTKYVTAPLAFPGTPEWGMMLNVKEDLAKDAWLN